MDTAERGARRGSIVFIWLLIGIAAVLPLLVTPMLPPIDLYNHIARFFILSRIDSDPFLSHYYASNWRLLPNLGLDLPAVWLARFVPPLVLAKLIVGAVMVLQTGAALLLHRALTGRVNMWSAALILALSYSFILNWGFINYLLAQSIVLAALALWIVLRDRPLVATLVCGAIAVLILLCHGFSFGLYGLLVGSLELGLWWQAQMQPQEQGQGQGERNVRDLVRALPALLRGWALIAVQAIVPLALFAMMPTSHATTSQTAQRSETAALDVTLLQRLEVQTAHRVEAIVRVAETAWPWLDLLLFAATMAILALARRRGWIRIVPAAWPMLAVALLLVAVMPNGMFGAGHLFERMPLLFCLLLAASIDVPRMMTATAARLQIALLAIVLVRLVAVDLGWRAYAQHYADFQKVTDPLPPHALVLPVMVSGWNQRDGLIPRCQGLAPMTVSLKQAASPLFADAAQQPLVLTPPLNEAADLLMSDDQTAVALGRRPMLYDDQLARAAQLHGGYLLVCGADRLQRPMPSNLSLLAKHGEISLLRVR